MAVVLGIDLFPFCFSDVTRLCYVSLVMAMLFSTGEHVPANIHGNVHYCCEQALGLTS